MGIRVKIRNSQLWRSVFRHPAPVDRRNRVLVTLTNLFLHVHPVAIQKHALRFGYTWGMGLITFFLFGSGPPMVSNVREPMMITPVLRVI